MERFGYFGKIPSAKDFVFQGLPIRTTERWAGFMAEWLARGSRVHRDEWHRQMLTSPVWRFALGRDIISTESWIGLMASSIDGAGRLFPFTAMVEVEIDPGRQRSFEALDLALDALEPVFLDFMENGADKQPLLSALAETLAALKALPEAADDAMPLPASTEHALCLVGDPGDAAGQTLMAYPGRATAAEEVPSTYSLWWQAGTSKAKPARCLSRGMPQALLALPFFDADWSRHGWVRR